MKTSDNAAVVDTSYPWLPINSDTPRGTKLQLISQKYGVAMYSTLSAGYSPFFTHWAPLPTFP